MNERIDEILWQAGGYTKLNYPNDTFLDGRYALTQLQLDKFAELIVRECFYCVEILEKIAHASNADIPPDYDRQTYLKTLEAVTGLMKAHFGVKE
jgi:hypothetical protein